MLFRKIHKRILVVDDDRSIRGITRFILESSGYNVDTVETAARALREIKDHEYDLLILDISLNNRMAIKLFQTLKENKKYADIPVLFLLSSRASETLNQEKRQVVEAADAYLQKPLRAKEFIAKVHDLLDAHDDRKKSRSPEKTDSHRGEPWRPWRRRAIPTNASADLKRRTPQ